MRNQKEKMIFSNINGFGKIHLQNHTCMDVFVYGQLEMVGRHFIIHQDIDDLEYLVVSEASTGCILQNEYHYETVEDALHYEIPRIRAKQYYFATSVGNILVAYQMNLLKENLGLRTLAIDTALWL